MLSRRLQKLRGTPAVPPAPADLPPLTLAEALQAERRDIAQWIRERRVRPALYSSLDDGAVERVRQSNPARVDATLRAAERILRHEFDLLGSGPFVPVDPDRPVRDGYMPIDWYLDPVRALRF